MTLSHTCDQTLKLVTTVVYFIIFFAHELNAKLILSQSPKKSVVSIKFKELTESVLNIGCLTLLFSELCRR